MRSKERILAEAACGFFGNIDGTVSKKAAAAAFLKLLSKKNLFYLLPKIYHEMETLEKEKAGILEAEVVSSRALASPERYKIVAWLEERFRKERGTVLAKFSEDDALIGGILIRTKNKLIDATIRGQLNALAEKF